MLEEYILLDDFKINDTTASLISLYIDIQSYTFMYISISAFMLDFYTV